MAKIKRSEVLTYIDTGSSTYELLGEGIVTGLINYNPKVTEETYIHQTNATISVEGYAPTMPVEATAVAGDAAFEYLDTLRKSRPTLADAETYIVNVWNYETGGPTAAPAEKQQVCVQFDSFGGEGGASAKISFTLNYIGDPVTGTFNTSTKVFT